MNERIVDDLDDDARVDPARAATRTGRLLRAGDVASASRADLRRWWSSRADAVAPSEAAAMRDTATAAAMLARLETGAPSMAIDEIVRALEARDDGESIAVALGFASLSGVDGAAAAEARVLEALRAIDATAEPIDHAIVRALREGAPTRARLERLARLARLDASSWWLDAIAVYPIDARGVLARLPSPSARIGPPVLRVRREAVARPAAMMMGSGELGGLDAVLERPLGDPIATLFDDEVELFAFGLAANDDAPPGVLVRQRDGQLDRIESVALDPPGPAAPIRSLVDLAWWVPLSGTADARRLLRVRYRGGDVEEATVDIELDETSPAPSGRGSRRGE